MSKSFDINVISSLRQQLYEHPIYHSVKTLDDLKLFMSHHVYSVWDFMSLVKSLQGHIAPPTVPWVPSGYTSGSHFINSIVLEEESDEALPGKDGERIFASHFELYCQAMAEIGIDTTGIMQFIDIVKSEDLQKALQFNGMPAASRQFTGTSFEIIASKKIHRIAAALALGREHIIPQMFRSLLNDMAVDKQQVPVFQYYLERHIHLDEGFHGPQSLKLLDELCEGDPKKVQEAEATACEAIQARIQFWDGVLVAINSQ